MSSLPVTLQNEDNTAVDTPKEAIPFVSYNEVLAEAEGVFQARRAWQRAQDLDPLSPMAERKENRYRELRAIWHTRAKSSELPLCQQCLQIGVTDLEHELLWGALSLNTGESAIGINPFTTKGLLTYISVERHDRLDAIASLAPSAPLITHNLLFLSGDLEDDPLSINVFPEMSLCEQLFQGRGQSEGYWSLEHEHELYPALHKLYRLLDKSADEFVEYCRRGGGMGDFRRRSQRIAREWEKFTETLKRHPTWSWNRSEVQALSHYELRILVTLAARALEILPAEWNIFSGQGLISTLVSHRSGEPENPRSSGLFVNLQPTSTLLRDGWIRPITEDSQHYTGSDDEITKTRFELDDRAFETLALERNKRQTIDGVTLREPKITFEQLSLSPTIEESIRLTVTQARANRGLFQEWGLADRIQYGLHPVLLFYGDPGTGKTATAEALAHELDRPLIVADYSKLENCFVGVTEKNVVRIFQEAQRRKAVLFWDEADAMLFDRDDAHRNWEVRHVNVILQQIERFEGVCILATNRRQKLDKALSRRISMQVEFRRPQTAAERLRIWNAMLPPQLPLDSGVDLGVIAQEDLSGGEIKNVLLNAARFAAARAEAHPKLTHADFEEAVRWETKARQEKREPVGFCRASLR
jgi:hypothetical protein